MQRGWVGPVEQRLSECERVSQQKGPREGQTRTDWSPGVWGPRGHHFKKEGKLKRSHVVEIGTVVIFRSVFLDHSLLLTGQSVHFSSKTFVGKGLAKSVKALEPEGRQLWPWSVLFFLFKKTVVGLKLSPLPPHYSP